MDRRERFESVDSMMLAALSGWQADMWTALPGIVQSFDAAAQTCEVQPSIRYRIESPAIRTYKSETLIMDASGQFGWERMPLLLDCPVVFPGGGGVTLTFPIQQGDEVLVIFASRCIDGWWHQGGIQNQAAVRMHDLSDGFVLPQVRSRPRQFAVSGAAAQLRTDDGGAVVELVVASKAVKVTTTGSADVTASAINLNGPVNINGPLNVTGASTLAAATMTGATIGGISFGTHKHTDPQGGQTGGPV